MASTSMVPQLRMTDISSLIGLYAQELGFTVELNHQDYSCRNSRRSACIPHEACTLAKKMASRGVSRISIKNPA